MAMVSETLLAAAGSSSAGVTVIRARPMKPGRELESGVGFVASSQCVRLRDPTAR